MIDYRELFSAGAGFEAFAKTGLAGEIAAVKEARAKLNSEEYVSSELKEQVKQVCGAYYLLTAAELWCPDCQRNVTAMQFISELQPTISQAIISKSRAERTLLPALSLDKVRIPFTVVLDEKFEPIGTFVERPQKVIHGGEAELQAYREGRLLHATIEDILAIIQKHQAARG